MKSKIKYLVIAVFSLLFLTTTIFPHCDSINGPVVKAAKKALETGNVNYVLIWVQSKDEKEIRDIFDRTMKVRILNKDARELADNYFFETVVRIHRMGEGVGYTGLRTADYKPEKGIEAADVAIEKNSVDDILENLNEEQHAKVKDLFSDLLTKRDFNVDNIDAGRKYVAAYVYFIHYVEALYNNGTPESGNHHH